MVHTINVYFNLRCVICNINQIYNYNKTTCIRR